jgi:hypothetical protein
MKLGSQEAHNSLPECKALIPRQPNQHHVIHITDIVFDLEFSLYEMIYGIQINQSINLTKQVAYWDANRCIHFRKDHHNINKAFVLDLLFDQRAKNFSIYGIEKLAYIEL